MLTNIFPFLKWFPISREELRAEFIAGLTVSLVLIPQSMAYAELAGLPPWIGLYAAFLPAIFGALWGSSNNLQTGPAAMVSLLTSTAIMPFAVIGSTEYIVLASQLAFIVGIIWLLIAFLRLTFIVNFLSRPVIEGFIHASAIIIVTSQFTKILGLKMSHSDSYLLDFLGLFEQLGHTNMISFALGIIALVVLRILDKVFPRVPAALLVLALSSLAVFLLGLSDPKVVSTPVTVVGHVPRGLPRLVNAVPEWSKIVQILPGAAVIAFVGFIEMCSVVKGVAAKSKQRLNINQETIGQGIASLSSAVSGGYPVSGSFSRTALDYAAGSKTGMSAVFTGMFVMVFLSFFTKFLYFLPKAVLAAIIVSAVLKLMHFGKFVRYAKISKADALSCLATFGATLWFAPHLDQGILFGAALSITMHLIRTMKPHVALLARHPDGTMRDAEKHGLEVDPEMPTIRFGGRLYFADVSYFQEKVFEVCERFPNTKYIALACDGINAIDASGEEMLWELTTDLRKSNVQLLFVGIKHPVMDKLFRNGLDKHIGEEHFFRRLIHAREQVSVWLGSELQ